MHPYLQDNIIINIIITMNETKGILLDETKNTLVAVSNFLWDFHRKL